MSHTPLRSGTASPAPSGPSSAPPGSLHRGDRPDFASRWSSGVGGGLIPAGRPAEEVDGARSLRPAHPDHVTPPTATGPDRRSCDAGRDTRVVRLAWLPGGTTPGRRHLTSRDPTARRTAALAADRPTAGCGPESPDRRRPAMPPQPPTGRRRLRWVVGCLAGVSSQEPCRRSAPGRTWRGGGHRPRTPAGRQPGSRRS